MLFCNLCIPPEVTQYFIYKGKRPQPVFTFAFVVLGQGGGYWSLKSVGLDSVILDFWKGERALLREKTRENWIYPDEDDDATFTPLDCTLEYRALRNRMRPTFYRRERILTS
jgi:hypothetical protein